MMTETLLTLNALALLLRLLNSPSPGISGSLLFEEFPAVAGELVSGLFLKPTGCLGYLTDGHQGFADLVWCPEIRRHRYFSVSAGWVEVSAERINRYMVDVAVLLIWLQGLFGIGVHHRITSLIPDRFWHLGSTRFHGCLTHVYFVRSLDSTERLLTFMSALEREASRAPAIVVCSSSRLPERMGLPRDMALEPLVSLMSRSHEHCFLDDLSIRAILRGSSVAMSEEGGIGLSFTSDYRRVYWNGESYALTKKQSAVMEALHREGGRAHKDLLRAAAETNEELHRIMRNKIDGKWVLHPLWNTLIKKEGGGYYFLDGRL
ncbi:hypothetical protein HCH_05617 [Hahella chejuensis KCTC 2396]|uniref:Uncharacterized protein n=1 Tax=Hahella chejuensis (strain KCTC 2396) TaxID=349521 RepID=Q2SAP9_HAHCH|nr:hypothetical protein [Hahella chejuensis]ABC32275.1 hypothetical protein HCH_05617 [Hahella chejuensis KCTC 2396]